jgi:hypothetical protein
MSYFDDWVSTLTVSKTFKQYKISLMSEHVEKNHIINFISFFFLPRRNTISLTKPINISHLFVFLKKKKRKVEGEAKLLLLGIIPHNQWKACVRKNKTK